MENCRLRVKFGPFEMEAEGPRDFVEKHYGSFSERVPPSNALSTIQEHNTDGTVPSLPGSGPQKQTDQQGASLSSIFNQDSSGKVSLTAKPSGNEAELDALLLLLLGHKELRGIDLVSALELASGMRQWGFPVERVDRIVGSNDSLVQKFGEKKGTRYRITNQGMIRARATGKELLAQVT